MENITKIIIEMSSYLSKEQLNLLSNTLSKYEIKEKLRIKTFTIKEMYEIVDEFLMFKESSKLSQKSLNLLITS